MHNLPPLGQSNGHWIRIEMNWNINLLVNDTLLIFCKTFYDITECKKRNTVSELCVLNYFKQTTRISFFVQFVAHNPFIHNKWNILLLYQTHTYL